MKIKVQNEPDVTLLMFSGKVDETISNDLANLQSQINTNRIICDLADLEHINSTGIELWINFFSLLPKEIMVEYIKCSIPFVDVLNIIPMFRCEADVKSVYVPYSCSSCNESEVKLFDVETLDPDADFPEVQCASCGTQMDPETDVGDYLAFLMF